MKIPYFPSEGWPNYHIAYVYQIVIMWMGCNLIVGVELFTFFYIQFICCRIEILTQMIKQWNNKIKCSNQSDLQARKNNLLFGDIVEYHSSIKQNRNEIQRIFSPILMTTLLSTMIVLCLSLFIISQVKSYDLKNNFYFDLGNVE